MLRNGYLALTRDKKYLPFKWWNTKVKFDSLNKKDSKEVLVSSVSADWCFCGQAEVMEEAKISMLTSQ
jgi:hypothetical protein